MVMKMPRIKTKHHEEARNQIIAAALAIAAKNGWDAVTLEAIARYVCVTKPALYSYFKNREDLLHAVVYVVFENIRSSLKLILTDENNIHRLVRNLADLFFEQQEASANLFLQIPIKMMKDLQSSEDFIFIFNDCVRLICTTLSRAQSAGMLAPTVDPDESTIAIVMMAMGLTVNTLPLKLDVPTAKRIWITSVERLLLLEPGAV
jgi:AcrR family transcriptional regulator